MPADVSQLLAFATFTRSVGRTVRTQVGKEVKNTTEKVLNDAFNAAPELTGELRESLEGKARGLRGTVSASARYAQFVEYGTGHGPPQPFLTPAADKADSSFPPDVEEAVVRALGKF